MKGKIKSHSDIIIDEGSSSHNEYILAWHLEEEEARMPHSLVTVHHTTTKKINKAVYNVYGWTMEFSISKKLVGNSTY